MFPTRKRTVLVHLGDKVIRTAADHPFFVADQGWAGDKKQVRAVHVPSITDSGSD